MGRISQRVAAIEEVGDTGRSALGLRRSGGGTTRYRFRCGRARLPHACPRGGSGAAGLWRAPLPQVHRNRGPARMRAAIAERSTETGFDVEPSQVVVTNGGKQAVFEALATLIDPGDEFW